MPGGLAVLLVGAHHALSVTTHIMFKCFGIRSVSSYLLCGWRVRFLLVLISLPAGQQLHEAGVLVDVAIGAADGAIIRGKVAGHGAVFPVCGNVTARS